jgi:hypothetical protein
MRVFDDIYSIFAVILPILLGLGLLHLYSGESLSALVTLASTILVAFATIATASLKRHP